MLLAFVTLSRFPVTLRPSACLSKEAKAFYSVVRWKWKSVSVRNCSSVSASSLPNEEGKKGQKARDERGREHGRPACPLPCYQPQQSIIPDAPHLTHYPRGLKVRPFPIPSGHLTLLNTTNNADDIAVA